MVVSLIMVDVESVIVVVVSAIIVDVESDTVVVDSVFVLEQAVASAIIERKKNADFAMFMLE
ncbi:hypothetical protein GCM10027085_37980 [Spirosoma aerophilum]